MNEKSLAPWNVGTTPGLAARGASFLRMILRYYSGRSAGGYLGFAQESHNPPYFLGNRPFCPESRGAL